MEISYWKMEIGSEIRDWKLVTIFYFPISITNFKFLPANFLLSI